MLVRDILSCVQEQQNQCYAEYSATTVLFHFWFLWEPEDPNCTFRSVPFLNFCVIQCFSCAHNLKIETLLEWIHLQPSDYSKLKHVLSGR